MALSFEFSDFANDYNFHHVTSSRRSNGLAERTVQTVKKLFRESQDGYMSLLSYRVTPLPFCCMSPAELLMGRHLRTNVPVLTNQLIPCWESLNKFKQLDKQHKHRQAKNFNQQHHAKELPLLPDDCEVWVTSGSQPVPERIDTLADTLRSYVVRTPTGQIRRNLQMMNSNNQPNPLQGN